MKKVDIKGGQMTFGQRIELGRIVSDKDLSEYKKFRACMVCLDPKWTVRDMPRSMKYWEAVLEGISYWVQREAVELKYNPTPEELAAGIEAFTLHTGEMTTIMAIAEQFNTDPDIILEWKYGKVFNILFTNLQAHLYRERLNKQLAKKAQNEARKHRRK